MARSVVARVAALAMATLTMVPTAHAAESACASDDESRGFTLRHLQSRLMVAALSCNQRDAYNNFVLRFTGELGTGGKSLIAYFNRTGGGGAALNKHVTDLANAAGLSRASDPSGFCTATWQVFWELQQKPELLGDFAERSLMSAVAVPRACNDTRGVMRAYSTGVPAAPANSSAAPQEAKAAVR